MATILNHISNKVILWINIILKLLDIGTTIYLVNIYGLYVESNPVMKYVMENCGLIPTMVGILLAYLVAVTYLYKKNRRGLLFVVMGLMTLVVIANTTSIIIR